MKALSLEAPGRFRMLDAAPPREPGPGEAVVRVGSVGICGSDLHAYNGRQIFFSYPRILGHELGVEIVALGETDDAISVGDRCALEPYLNCGSCVACRVGKTNCCVSLTVLGVHTDGGMQEYLLVPARKLHRSRELSLEQLAVVEPLAVGAHAVGRAGLQRGETTLVIGCGPIGLAVLEAAKLAGTEPVVLEVSKKRLEYCRDVEPTRCLEAGEDPPGQVREVLSGELPAAVFDCTGNPRSMAASFRFVAHGGRLIFVGHFPGDVTFHNPDFHAREMTLLATRNATAQDFAHVLRSLESGAIDTSQWVRHKVPASQAAAAFPGWLNSERDLLKPIVEW